MQFFCFLFLKPQQYKYQSTSASTRNISKTLFYMQPIKGYQKDFFPHLLTIHSNFCFNSFQWSKVKQKPMCIFLLKESKIFKCHWFRRTADAHKILQLSCTSLPQLLSQPPPLPPSPLPSPPGVSSVTSYSCCLLSKE